MKPYYVCTKEGYCPGQAKNGWCKTRDHPERLRCPHIKEVSPRRFAVFPTLRERPGVKDPDTPHFWGPSLWVVQELMKERRP